MNASIDYYKRARSLVLSEENITQSTRKKIQRRQLELLEEKQGRSSLLSQVRSEEKGEFKDLNFVFEDRLFISLRWRRLRLRRKYKIHGFTLSTDAIEEVLSFLAGFPDAEDEALELLIDQIDKESLKSSILDKATIHKVVSLLLETNEAVDPCVPTSSDRAALKVIDAFVVPRFKYDPIKRVFYEHTGRLPIHGEASDKASLYRERYHLLHQRLSRDKYFSRPVFDTDISESGSCEITSIQSLIDCTERRWLMGVISQLEEGSFYLEDLTAAVPIDLSNAIAAFCPGQLRR